MNTIPEEIGLLIVTAGGRELSEEEQMMLDTWLQEHPGSEKEILEILQFTRDCELSAVLPAINSRKAWEQIAQNTPKTADWGRQRMRYWKMIAAVVVPILFISSAVFYFYQVKTDRSESTQTVAIYPGKAQAELVLANGKKMTLKNSQEQKIVNESGQVIGIDSSNILTYHMTGKETREWNTLQVPLGGEYCLVLSDGTKVWVNADTELEFPVQFYGKERQVKLKGEAYFEVTKDREHPFVVMTACAGIRVLGTSFNMSCYEEDGTEQTTLVEGAVEVITPGNVCVLQPGKQLQINVKDRSILIKEVDTQLYSSWKDGIFRFCDMPLEELTTKLKRWYNVNFFFEQEECKTVRFTGAIRKYTDFHEFIKLVEITTNVKFSVQGDAVTIRKK